MKRLEIRQSTFKDWAEVARIENICFPAAEAASEASIKERLSVYPEGSLIAASDHKIIGFICGGATDKDVVDDDFYASMKLHDPKGRHLIVFGLDILPDYQRQGYARQLMQAYIDFAEQQNKSAILLTCKEHLLPFYSSFGYKNLGVAASTHGGAQWFEMKLLL